MFKTILKAFRTILQAFKKVNWERVAFWTPIAILVASIIYGFSGIVFGNDEPYKMWEDAAICSTVVYTLVILLTGILEKDKEDKRAKFEGVNRNQGILLGVLLLLILVFAYINLFNETLQCVGRLQFFLYISICYVIIDCILIKADIPEKNETINALFYCDGPTFIIFSVLLIYAACISVFQKTSKVNDSFFSGAIAFQMILASIVWWFIDNCEHIKKWKLIKKLIGG